MRALFDAFPTHELAGFIIWVPMLSEDTPEAVRLQQRGISDRRFRFWFDSDQAAAKAWSSFIGYPGTTWDVYAIYGQAASWAGQAPPAPEIWMHQLNETPATRRADRLNVARLARRWLALVGGRSPGETKLARALDERGRAVSGGVGPDSAPE